MATQLSASGAPFLKTNVIFEVTQAQIAIVKNNFQQAIDSSNLALKMNPNSKAAGVVLVESLLAAGKVKEATDWLVLKTKYQKDDAIWWNFLAQGYALQNQSSLYHAALAEKYVCEGPCQPQLSNYELLEKRVPETFISYLSWTPEKGN